MSKLLTAVLAAVFAAVTLTPVAFAAKHEMEKKTEAKKTVTKKKADAKKKTETKKKADAKKKTEEKK